MFGTDVRNKKHAYLGYCGIAAGCVCCTGAHVSHTHAESSPNSVEETAQQLRVNLYRGLNVDVNTTWPQMLCVTIYLSHAFE